MAKSKKTSKKRNEEMTMDTSIRNVIIVVVVVLVVLGLFYLLTLEITKDDSTIDNSEQETVIQTEEILVGSSFNRTDKEYLVIYYDESNSDLNSSLYSMINTYKNKEERLPLYIVDMSNSFNKKYATENESNKNPSSVSEMQINGPTLIKFSEGSVVEYIEGEDAIGEYLA